jgi:DNA-binding LytR/AlgR family response regulator
MKILIADDELPARKELLFILEALLPDATFYEAVDGSEVVALAARQPVDVVFLDINMPGLDGLAAAAALLTLPSPPLIIFATAYDEHAVRAFELAALDYVVKPFNEQRLAQTVLRLQQTGQAEQQRAMETYIQQNSTAKPFTKLWGQRDNGNLLLVDYRDILWLAAENKKVYMQTREGVKLLVNQTLKALEILLAAHQFARVHKAFIVNLDYVAEVVPWFSGGYIVRMQDETGTEIPMSRRYATSFKKRTGWQ